MVPTPPADRGSAAQPASGAGVRIAVLLFDGITALDAIGPYEVLSRLPRATVQFVAPRPGSYRTDTGFLTLHAPYALADVASPDIVVVPGGPGTRVVGDDAQTLEWIRSVHSTSTWTTSVCTGALVLGAAGVLNGLQATTHWASRDRLASYGATVSQRRVVQEGKVITAAGVSAGIDMALRLAQLTAGARIARAIRLIIEYDPQGSLDLDGPLDRNDDVAELAKALLQSPFAAPAGQKHDTAGFDGHGATRD